MQKTDPLKLFDANRESWNQRTRVHLQSAFYDVEGFKKGKSSLNAIELEDVGDVRGKSLLHLQCHFGQDTLSWQRLGAQAVGVDLSNEAIEAARSLNSELGLDARFVNSNVYDLKAHLSEKFDIVFTSYGTIGWLPDLKKWADVVAHFLKPGGFFYIADFHPTLWMYDDDIQKVTYSYFNDQVISTPGTGTYTDGGDTIQVTDYSWNHPLSDILTALIDQGLKIELFREFPFSPYNCFKNQVQGADGMWRFTTLGDRFPVMYSLRARKEK